MAVESGPGQVLDTLGELRLLAERDHHKAYPALSAAAAAMGHVLQQLNPSRRVLEDALRSVCQSAAGLLPNPDDSLDNKRQQVKLEYYTLIGRLYKTIAVAFSQLGAKYKYREVVQALEEAADHLLLAGELATA